MPAADAATVIPRKKKITVLARVRPQSRLWFVSYYFQPTNTFQLALATDGSDTYAILNYETVAFTQTSMVQARVGFLSGSLEGYFELDQSENERLQDLVTDSNVGVAGRFIFEMSTDETVVYECTLDDDCNNGNCVSNFCSCDDGFTGISCDVMESADSVTDSNDNSDATDACEEENIDCNGHGECDNTNDGWECTCDEGYRGLQCRKYSIIPYSLI